MNYSNRTDIISFGIVFLIGKGSRNKEKLLEDIGIASTLQLGGPHIVKDEMQVEDQLSMLNWGVLP